MGVVGFILSRWVHSGAPRMSLGSVEVVGFIRVRPDSRLGSTNSLGRVVGVVRFVRVRPGRRWV